MTTKIVRWPAVGLAVLLLVSQGAAAEEAKAVPESRQQIELSYAPLVKKTAPAVVNIYTRTVVRQQVSPLFDDPFFRRFFGQGGPFPGLSRERVENSLGSGVLVDSSGLIVTNHHVIAGADQITVALADRREFEAKVVSSDEHTDLAVLRIDAKGEKLPYLTFGDSDDLEVGDMVLAIGDPFGVGQTVTSGIVSALARTNIGTSDLGYFIQTDAAINPGNSGGALIDMKGELIGINTALYSRSGGWQGIGFAIPSNMAKAVMRAALAGKPIAHPWLGIAGAAVTQKTAAALGLSRPQGVLVQTVHPFSPAIAAGLEAGDVIAAVNGHDVGDPEALRFRIATLAVGDEVKLDALRDGRKFEATVKLIAPPERPKRDATQVTGENPLQGATIANLSPALADDLGVDDMQTGVVVTDVPGNSTAARLDFEPGDIILKLNDQPLESVGALMRILDANLSAWRFTFNRRGRTLTNTVRR